MADVSLTNAATTFPTTPQPAITDELSLKSAFALIEDTQAGIYLNNTLPSIRVNVNQTLRDFIEAIRTDPERWFQAFPPELNAKTSLAKPKTALLKILDHQRTRQVYGDEWCDAQHKFITTEWKEHSPRLIDIREAQRKSKGNKAPLTPPSEAGYSQPRHNPDTTPTPFLSARINELESALAAKERILEVEKKEKATVQEQLQESVREITQQHEKIQKLKRLVEIVIKRYSSEDEEVFKAMLSLIA